MNTHDWFSLITSIIYSILIVILVLFTIKLKRQRKLDKQTIEDLKKLFADRAKAEKEFLESYEKLQRLRQAGESEWSSKN